MELNYTKSQLWKLFVKNLEQRSVIVTGVAQKELRDLLFLHYRVWVIDSGLNMTLEDVFDCFVDYILPIPVAVTDTVGGMCNSQ